MSLSPSLPSARPVPLARRWRAPLVRVCSLAAVLVTGPAVLGQASAAWMPAFAPGSAPAHATLHEEILRLLEKNGAFPREADWAPLGPEALGELTGLAGDPKAPEPQRTRAVAAMAVVAHPEAALRIQEILRGQASPASVRAAATLALGRRSGVEAVPMLAPLLEDPSEEVRATAARTLGRMGGAEARQMLEDRLVLEESPSVREALQQGLSYVEP